MYISTNSRGPCYVKKEFEITTNIAKFYIKMVQNDFCLAHKLLIYPVYTVVGPNGFRMA